jgi:hypothetical protein
MAQRTNLPVDQDYTEAKMPEQTSVEYTDEQVLASMAGTKGWKKISDWADNKKKYYQTYYPGGDGISRNTSDNEIAIAWKSAVEINALLDELKNLVESARDNVKARQQ